MIHWCVHKYIGLKKILPLSKDELPAIEYNRERLSVLTSRLGPPTFGVRDWRSFIQVRDSWLLKVLFNTFFSFWAVLFSFSKLLRAPAGFYVLILAKASSRVRSIYGNWEFPLINKTKTKSWRNPWKAENKFGWFQHSRSKSKFSFTFTLTTIIIHCVEISGLFRLQILREIKVG